MVWSVFVIEGGGKHTPLPGQADTVATAAVDTHPIASYAFLFIRFQYNFLVTDPVFPPGVGCEPSLGWG